MRRNEKTRARDAKARTDHSGASEFEDRLAEYLLTGEGGAWMRFRLEQERIEAEGAERDDGTPPILKGWRKL